jgi:hypothetical protein
MVDAGETETYGLELREIVALLVVIVVLEVLHERDHLAVVLGRAKREPVELLQHLLHLLFAASAPVRLAHGEQGA